MRLIVLVFAVLVGLPVTAHAQTIEGPTAPVIVGTPVEGRIQLAWDANPEPFVTGYRVFLGTSPQTLQPTDVGPALTYTFTGLTNGVPYALTVAALAAAAPQPPQVSPSPDLTAIPPASVIVDLAGDRWTLSGDQIQRNGTPIGGGRGSLVVWWNTTMYAIGTDARWWKWTGAAWVQVLPTEPAPPVTGVTPMPINAVVSDWSVWVPGTWSACTSGTQTRTETRTRTMLTPAENGGSTPPLSETRTVSQACSAYPPLLATMVPKTCSLTVSVGAGTPDGKTGWKAQILRNGSSHGNASSSFPFERKADVPAGTYAIQVRWTKGSTTLLQSGDEASCQVVP